ncbi:MAG: NADH:flavin oxidoreductase [Oscillospiraceae bacterium]|nr:NADH:flavin oxidoreductase [Oscillospiraceae bacterium]
MAKHEKFNFRSADELRAKAAALGCNIALSEDTTVLGKPVKIAGKTAPNAMAVLPMEGCDCLPCGGVSELFARRYLRFAAGGAGLLWWEACAVLHEARANPLQMMLTDSNASALAKLLEQTNKAAPARPVNILQLTHSGRYSRHTGHKFTPILAQHDPLLDPRVGATEHTPLASDTYLESLPEYYIKAAKLAQKCGFDGVDIKACHRYLISELLAAHNRPGKYGGSFDNRTRLLCEIIAEVRKHTSPGFIIACRFNATDAHPNGFDKPVALTELLVQCGVQLLGVSAGNPYYTNPQMLRPFDQPGPSVPLPHEHPLENTARLFELTAQVQAAAGDIPVMGAGYSWLRQFAPQVAAANLSRGQSKFMGLGRQSFAYPDAPLDILASGMNPQKCCTACSKCTQMMRDHTHAGCVIRDSRVYAPIYKQGRADACARQQS